MNFEGRPPEDAQPPSPEEILKEHLKQQIVSTIIKHTRRHRENVSWLRELSGGYKPVPLPTLPVTYGNSESERQSILQTNLDLYDSVLNSPELAEVGIALDMNDAQVEDVPLKKHNPGPGVERMIFIRGGENDPTFTEHIIMDEEGELREFRANLIFPSQAIERIIAKSHKAE